MKTFFKFGLMVVFIFCSFFFSIKAEAKGSAASDNDEVYLVKSTVDGYLIEYGEDSFSGTSLTEVIERVTLMSSDAEISFSEIETSETLIFTEGKYLLSGKLKFKEGAGIVIENSELTLKNITIDFSGGEIRNKKGRLSIENAFIEADRTAIKMDYSSAAVFEMKSGEISVSSETAALCIEYGTARIGGGSIVNGIGTAIYSSSTLILYGAPQISGIDCDVFVKSPITLSEGNQSFTAECRVRYDREFEKGKISVIAYGATTENEEKIKLYDRLGREQRVKFYSESNTARERNFLTAYLPYEIKFMGDTTDVQYKLEGEKIEPPEPALREGYDFVTWKSGGASGENFEISSGATKDEVFYPSYKLKAPTFFFSSMDFVYTEEGKYLSLENLEHPLLEDGIMSYKWFKDGEELQVYSDKILIKNLSDGGKYKCLFTFSHGSNSVSIETPEVSVVVSKKLIELPTIPSVYYDGHFHSPEVYPLSTYTVTGEGGVKAGEYPITFSVTDAENYGFYPDGSERVTLNFNILKSQNEWLESIVAYDVYCWENLKVKATSRFGEVAFLFADALDGNFSENVPAISGTYYVKAVVNETDNYFGLNSEPFEFKILTDEISSLYIVSDATNKSYKAFEQFNTDGLSVCAGYVSGREELLSLSDISISYHCGETLLFGDASVVINYGGISVLYSVDVSKAEYDVSSVVFSDFLYEYSGKFIAPTCNLQLPVGLDGIPLSAEIVGGGTNVGEYLVELRFFTESKNYTIPDSIRRVMIISPKTVQIIWNNLSYVYDGTLKIPSAHFIDLNGNKIDLSVKGAHSFAGVYEAEASFAGKNYTADNKVAVFEILKADYDLSGAFWSASEFVYCGSEQSVTLLGLPKGVAVVGYSDNRATDAGTYIAGATLSYDAENYNPPQIQPFEWIIRRAEYDLSGVQFSDGEFVYDGNKHFPLVLGTLPIGFDKSSPVYDFSQGVTNVSEGKTLIKISFSTSSKNYNPPADVFCFVTVLPIEIEVEWENFTFTYSGLQFSPTAAAPESVIVVSGAQINAGKYIATARALDTNYAVKNRECEFEILKAENSWSIQPSVSDIYASQSLSVTGQAEYGITEYIYSSNMADTLSLPDSCGIFYFMAVCEGDENHLPIRSEWLKFEIIEVIAVDFFIEMAKNSFLSLDKIGEDDFKAFVKNNDASTVEIPYSEIGIVYLTGDCLHLSDETVCFTYQNFSIIEAIGVSRRDYDLSGVLWDGLRVVYDGREKHAQVIGLPDGVEVLGYVGNGSVNAGMYVISVRLSYDTENYNEPILADVIMTIEKQTVFVPDITSADYTAKLIFPSVAESDLYYYEFEGAKNAGEYKILFTLHDSENYTFEGNLNQIEKSFFINKIKLTVQVSDIEKYLFGKYGETEYKIIGGNLIDGETIYPIYEIGEDSISVRFENENYSIDVIDGKVNKYNRLSPKDTRLFIFLLTASVFGFVGIVLIIVNRKKILNFYRLSSSASDTFIPTPPLESEPDPREDTDIVYGEPSEAEGDTEDEDEQTDIPIVIDAEYADSVITDSLARDLIRRESEIKTNGTAKRIINVDTLSRSFVANDRVDINVLKSKSLIPYDTGYIKILARGIIDKPLCVYANDFSLSAVKMIALAGGKSVKVSTVSIDNAKIRKKT